MALHKTTIIIITFAFFVSSCTATGNKEGSGTLIGAVTGAIVGSVIGGKNSGTGALIGGLVGAAIGNRIGHSLDERDRKALEQQTAELITSVNRNASATWRSDHSGATAVITKQPTEEKWSKFEITPEEKPLYKYTNQDVVVRSGPGGQYAVSETLKINSLVKLEDNAPNGWYKISNQGKEVGYVASNVLSNSITRVSELPLTSSTGSKVTSSNNEGTRMSEHEKEEAYYEYEPPKREELAALEDNVLIARNQCSDVKVRVRNNNGQVTESIVNTCVGPDGSLGY